MKLIYALIIALPSLCNAIDLTTEQMIGHCQYRIQKIEILKQGCEPSDCVWYFFDGEQAAYEEIINLLWTNTD